MGRPAPSSARPPAPGTPATAGGVVVRSRGGPHGLSGATLRRRASRMLDHLGKSDAELTVLLVDDTTMRSLNGQWRGKDSTTDVLSFPMAEGEYGDVNPQLLGDVVISVPMAAKQASRAGHTTLDEATMLLAHGVLHLLGYDHQTPKENREMVRRTEELVQATQGSARGVTSRR